MRTHLNDRSKDELIAVMQALGFTSTNPTLNVIITQREVNTNDHSSTDHQ